MFIKYCYDKLIILKWNMDEIGACPGRCPDRNSKILNFARDIDQDSNIVCNWSHTFLRGLRELLTHKNFLLPPSQISRWFIYNGYKNFFWGYGTSWRPLKKRRPRLYTITQGSTNKIWNLLAAYKARSKLRQRDPDRTVSDFKAISK